MKAASHGAVHDAGQPHVDRTGCHARRPLGGITGAGRRGGSSAAGFRWPSLAFRSQIYYFRSSRESEASTCSGDDEKGSAERHGPTGLLQVSTNLNPKSLLPESHDLSLPRPLPVPQPLRPRIHPGLRTTATMLSTRTLRNELFLGFLSALLFIYAIYRLSRIYTARTRGGTVDQSVL
jgi:hypothetical protein